MKDCDICTDLRKHLLIKLKGDITIDFHEWYFSWLKGLDDMEFMKEFFMNTTIHQRVAYDFKSEIKKHIETSHNIKLGVIL